MPPEPSPWDRRDFRRSGTSDRNFTPATNFSQRWQRDQNHHPYAPPQPPSYHRHQQQRWCSDFRSSRPLTPGHGKQGSSGWQMYGEEQGNGYLPFGSRYGDRNNNNFEDESNTRSPFVSRGGDGRYFGRNSRENRGWRGPSWEPTAASPSGNGRFVNEINNRRSIERTQTPYNSSMERTQTPYVERNQTPYVERNPTPYIERTQTPRTQTPYLERTHTPYLERTHTPYLERTHTPYLERTHTPYLERTHTPYMERTHTPYLERTQTPYMERTQTPYMERTQTPYMERTQTPYMERTQTPYNSSMERTQTPYNNISNRGTNISHRSGFANPLVRSQNQSPPRFISKEQQHKEGGTVEEPTFPSQRVEKVPQTVSTDWKLLKEQQHKEGGISEECASLSQKVEKENEPVSMDWKLLKEQQHKEGEIAEECASLSQKVEKENEPVSMDWKPLKEQQHKEGEIAEECASLSQKVEKKNEPASMDWKPLKWQRTGSSSSRSSGISNTISPMSTGVESVETVAAVQTKSITPLLSPTEDAATVCVLAGGSTHTPLDDSSSRKKPRLGWGQGLAKFEKKKVDGPEDSVMKDGDVVRTDNTETLQSNDVDFVDKSSTAVCLPHCASPATPSSMACSSSTGVEAKESIKSVNNINDMIKLTPSPITVSQALYSEPAFNLENLEPSSIANLSTLINEMLHSCGPSSVDSGCMQSSMLNKLSVLKVDVSKAIEVTESEIDSLETELKLLMTESRNSPYTASSSPRLEVCQLKPCEDQATTSKVNDEGAIAYTAVLGTVSSSQDLATGSSTCSDVNDSYSIIWASNKDCADRAMEELYKVPANMNQFDISMGKSVSSLNEHTLMVNENSLMVKEKFKMRKRFLQFKEKVLSLKFKVFRHFWKEGRVLSVRNLRLKSHEKYDISGHRKNRSIRSRISFFSGTPQTVPADEVIEVVNNLLSMMPPKPCRNTLKMPSLILDKKEMAMSRFRSKNGLIIDPRGVEKERSTINPWTSEETETFIDSLATFGKDFKKISSFLEHKTVADCIEFYYKNHKSQLFERAKKKPDSAKQRKPQSTTYLVASAKRWNREANAASLDMLGAASAIAANVDNRTETHQNCTSRFFLSPSSSSYKSPKGEDSERETVAADVLAGICGSISSEAMSSCISSSVEHGEVHYQDRKYHRVGSSKKRPAGSLRKRPLAPEVTRNGGSEDSAEEMLDTDWTDDEISVFVQAVSSYGKDFVMISQSVGTRPLKECKKYFWKAKKRFGLDLIQPQSIGSDTRDACDAETGSVVCQEATDNSKHSTKICELNNLPSEIDSMATETVIYDSIVCHREMGDKVVSVLNMEDADQNVENSSCEANQRVSEGNGKEESEGKQISLTDNLEVQKVKDVSSGEASGASATANEMKSDGISVLHPLVVNSSIQIQSGGKALEFQKKAYLEQISQVVPSVNSSKLFSVPIKYQMSPPHNALPATGNNNVIYDKRPPNIVDANDGQKNLSVLDSTATLQVFTGHPVSMQTKTQINDDLNFKRSIPMQNVPKQNGILHSDRFSLQKCNSSDQSRPLSSDRFALQKCNSLDQSRPLSSGSSDSDRPHRNGDIKLFGKILNASQPEEFFPEGQDNQLCKPGSQLLNVNFNGDYKASSDSGQSTFGVGNFMGSDNVPVKSCSFWDGNMIQGGFSRLPDSGLLLNKYPAAFGKCAMKLDQPSIANSSNGVAEYQASRNGDAQPFSVDMNQKQDLSFSEMTRRLGFDVISGLQQQANGMNVVGRGGVSDPVAAMKMHYASAEQFSLRGGSILKEDSSWRSNGDLGSR